MALLYDPGKYMPTEEDDFRWTSWMITWPDGPWHLHDLEIGGTVYLVSEEAQRIVWETRVTQTFAVPYEAVNGLAAEVLIRWGLTIETPDMSPGGFCMGWRAEPIGRLDRRPAAIPDHLIAVDDETLGLDLFQQSAHMSDAFRRRWGLAQEPEVFCDGRPAIGWFGP